MSLFDYQSKPMTFLNKLSDLLFINLLFVLCSLPVVTIGASQAGLYTAIKVFQDKEDDSSCLKAFFRGFAAGFWRITLVWCGYLALGILFAANLVNFLVLHPGETVTWVFAIALLLLALLEPMSVQFHARYVCSPWGLVKNALLFFLGNAVRAVPVAILTWLPMVLVFWLDVVFLKIVPVFILIYFSGAYWLCFKLMQKPFQKLAERKAENAAENAADNAAENTADNAADNA